MSPNILSTEFGLCQYILAPAFAPVPIPARRDFGGSALRSDGGRRLGL